MPLNLEPHPLSICPAVASIEVEAVRADAFTLVLDYTLHGRLDELIMPRETASLRKDELWRHSCFEAFVGPSDSDAYYEINLAPSTQWAAYAFVSYRAGIESIRIDPPPLIRTQRSTATLTLTATIDLFSDFMNAPWHLALSAVIEDTSGQTSYWALAHPPGPPDFHHPDCFTLELPAPDRA